MTKSHFTRVRIYSSREGDDRLWRQILGGAASSRFHRPPGGMGLNQAALAHIKSMRMWLDEYDIFTGQPDGSPNYGGGHRLLSNREWEEAWYNYREGKQYSVYFMDRGEVDLKTPQGQWEVRWLEIENSLWKASQTVATMQFL